MKRIFVLLLLHFLFHFRAGAQDSAGPLGLEEAIDRALSNNIGVRQSQLQHETSQVNHRQAKLELLPDINAGLSQGLSQGRSIDPSTNAYDTKEFMWGSYGVGAELVLFNGFRQQNTIRQTSYARQAAGLELQQAREQLVLQVMLAYLQVLNNQELVEVAQNQVQVTQQQVERLQRLHEQGAVNPPQLAEMLGQLKAEELSLLNARQSVESAKLALARQMNEPYDASLQLEPMALEALLQSEQPAADAEATYATASGRLALVRAAALRRQSAEAGVRAWRGNYYPTLSLGGSINSNYSSVAFMNGERIVYGEQLRNNMFSTISLDLRIPILNSLSSHNQVRVARLALEQASLQEEQTRVQLRQEIEEARFNATTARERYQVLQEQEKAFREAFRAAEIRFNAGAGSPLDYLIAKNNLDRSRTNLIMARYDYVFRQKILAFYLGR